jgi:hypothetical protein
MTDKQTFEKIDQVLKYICDADRPPFRTDGEIYKDCGFDQNSKELIEILFKLESEKYVQTGLNSSNIKLYYSTFDGRNFINNGGFASQKNKIIWQNRFTKFNTILSIVNILTIIVLTYFTYRATDKANDNTEQVKKYESVISRKNKIIDSLTAIRTK